MLHFDIISKRSKSVTVDRIAKLMWSQRPTLLVTRSKAALRNAFGNSKKAIYYAFINTGSRE